MQQGEDAQQSLVRVDSRVGDPSPEEASLLVEGEGLADEALGRLCRQFAGGIDQDHLVGLGEAEELPGDLQPPGPVLGLGGQERHDVVHVDQGPVLLAARADVLGQIAQGGQFDVECDVGAGQRPGPAGALAGAQQEGVEDLRRRPQRLEDGVDPAATASGGQPFGVIGGQRRPAFDEEDL
ncbi:hypothetical protein [Nonomuraea gerenzanensis]|uniref:hypothetical protein n=1 Tax=Nonomuraea gerenzanensis TaxID=93944 RepID=UPI001CDA522C|nr:hypothetical protein [Nonomuraea gerenzanensis]UBU10367.1 hypothetical protein LCN96_39390 [Nonomuraea gerenzanensis]